MLPDKVSEFIDGHGIAVDGDSSYSCEGAKFHSPTPLFVKQTPLTPTGGPGPTAWLCGTCRDNLAVVLALLVASDGELGWPVRREFGNQIRALAEKGWRAHVRATNV